MIKSCKDLRYTEGYKYRSSRTFWTFCNVIPFEEVQLGRITLTVEGLFILDRGYSSDGPSGLTIDTKNFMPGAMGWHDPMYELLRHPDKCLDSKCDIISPIEPRPGEVAGIYKISDKDRTIYHATHEQIRHEADRFLIDLLLTAGMSKFRSKYIYDGLRVGGESSARDERKVHVAPVEDL